MYLATVIDRINADWPATRWPDRMRSELVVDTPNVIDAIEAKRLIPVHIISVCWPI
jgi:hypothetical protein